MPQPWQTFADNADLYLNYARDWARRQAKRVADEQAIQIELAKTIAALRDADRWKALRAVIPEWPEMTDEDREFLRKVRALPEEQQTVSDEDLRRAQDISTRYREHWQRSQNYKLLQGIERMKTLICGSEYHKWKADDLTEFRRLEALVRAASYNAPELEDYKRQLIQLKPNHLQG
jgi:phage anti-repressor protein